MSWLLKLALSAALLATLAYLVGWESIGRQLLAADLGLVFLGWGLSMVRRAVDACLGVLSFGLFSHAIGIVVPILTLVWVRSALTLVRQLPISFHGVGVQEGSLLIMLGAYGIAAESAIGLGLLLFGNVLLFSLIGGLYQGALLLGWAKWTFADRSVDGDKRPIAP